ncbi:DMT family transporter [Calothrix sp. CCY 0018]|uniref:DMT family transporter n=1 Tax=Calothrix sp. CCY 0018 TaxID=3103864 RepID=UPI0039C715D1
MTSRLAVFQESSFLSNGKTRAIAALGICLISWAFVPILIRFGENTISPNALIFHRLWIASIILGLWKKFFPIQNQFSKDLPKAFLPYINQNIVLFIIATGIFFALSPIAWAWSITQTNIANSALLHNFTPVFVAIAGWLLFNQIWEKKFIIGLSISISGSVILGLGDFVSGSGKLQGDAIALLSALFFAIYLLLAERVKNQLDAITTLFYCCLTGTLGVLPILLISHDKILPTSGSEWLIIVGLGLLTVLANTAMLYALNWMSSGFVAVTFLLDPIISAIFAWLIFSERLNFYTLLAFPIILFGIYLATKNQSAIE